LTFFDDELKKGNFQICYCKNCNITYSSYSESCLKCLKKTNWKKSLERGKIIEFSRQNNNFFGIIEIEYGIRLMGSIIPLESQPEIGQKVKMSVSFDKKPNYSFVVENNQ
tara:strand:+ start:3372 stop:3701 length:330 start_codon:yes stop_codon:yes gene_type:complete